MALSSRFTRHAPETISAQRTGFGVAILLALNSSGRHIYEGTVPGVERQRRRAKNKAARQARSSHRRAARR